MPTIYVTDREGSEHVLEVENGLSIMEPLREIDDGVEALCGGMCSCATCHVVVDDAWWEKVGAPSDREESMLDLNPEREAHSRLSCQIPVRDELDGLVVNVPEFQM